MVPSNYVIQLPACVSSIVNFCNIIVVLLTHSKYCFYTNLTYLAYTEQILFIIECKI